MKTKMAERDQKNYIRKFKTLLNAGGISRDAELAMLAAYGVESCNDLTIHELIELCGKLELEVDPQLAQFDYLRKRLIATVSGWLTEIGKVDISINYVKAVACRAAGVDSFNKIGESALKSVTAEFARKEKIAKQTKSLKQEIIGDILTKSKLN